MKISFAALLSWLKSPEYSESRKLLLNLVAICIVILTSVLIGYRYAVEVEPTPCSKDRYPARCYRITEKQCQLVWTRAEVSCQQIIQTMSLPPTRLVAPIREKCQQAQIANAFEMSRITNAECETMHQELLDWQKRNSDFKF